MSLKKQTVSGLFWTFSQQFGVQLINFVVQIILARILLPAEFGLIGMITVFIAIGNTLMDSGLTSSLIRTPNPDQRDYSTVFFINLVGSILAYVILFFSAPFIARFYKQDILTGIIQVYTISFIIRAFVNVQTTRLTKEMDFKTQMTIQIPSVLGGGILGIVLAYMGFGVWSLVWMNLAQSTLSTIQHWVGTGWRPDWIFDRERFKHHFKFGYKLTLSGLLNTIYQNLYNLIIGKYFSATQLGFYTRAQTLQTFPVVNISNALNKVTYPLFSSIQHDNIRLKSIYKRLMVQVVFWVTPVMVGLILVAEPLFRLVLTEKWLPAVPYFQILCLSGIMYPLQMYNLNILNVKGRSDLSLRLEVIKKVIITVGIICSVSFGIYGLLYFQVITSLFSFYINSYYSGRMINYPVTEQVKDIAPIFILAILTGAAGWLLNKFIGHLFNNVIDIARIMIVGTFFMLAYLGSSHLMKMSTIHDFRQLVLKR